METTLYYRDGSSDKVYQAAVEAQGDGYVVTFAFGRRGSTLQTGTKTPAPVSLECATAIYQKLIDEKMAKGYSPGERGTPYINTSHEDRATGLVCQLLNPIEESELQELLDDDGVVAQEKYDGKRMLLHVMPDSIVAINRRGLTCGFPQPVEEDARRLRGSCAAFTLDGECVGETYCAFDLLMRLHDNERERPYHIRLEYLDTVLRMARTSHIQMAETADGRDAKIALLARLRVQGREGIVFKRLAAPYTPGRPASGGAQLKYKFTATGTVYVNAVSAHRRSVIMAVNTPGHLWPWTEVGHVTIPPNYEIPPVGTIVEVRYLYAYPGGNLYQPVYLGVRDDVGIEACTLTQLKFKSTSEEDESA